MTEWGEYHRLIIFRLDEAKLEINRLAAEVALMHREMSTLKVKASIWGLAAGAIPVTIAVVMRLVL